MLQIDYIDDKNIRIRQGSTDVVVGAAFVASVGAGRSMTLIPREGFNYPSFKETLDIDTFSIVTKNKF